MVCGLFRRQALIEYPAHACRAIWVRFEGDGMLRIGTPNAAWTVVDTRQNRKGGLSLPCALACVIRGVGGVGYRFAAH